MEHPLRASKHLEKRKRLTELLKSKYDLIRQDSIVFVCGGNRPRDARNRFLKIAPTILKEYDFFTPESALKNNWQVGDGPFELTRFEELIAEISLAVVVFPEGPGSFCETGYFAAKQNINKKTLLALNSKFQSEDSFISTGPVHLVNEFSDFRPTQYINYKGNFSEVIDRIKKRKPEKHRKAINALKYKDLTFLEKLGLVQKVVDLLAFATADDIYFVFRSAFNSHISEHEISALIAILRGSNYFLVAQPYGHLFINRTKPSFLEIRSGAKGSETEIRFLVAELAEQDELFSSVMTAVRDVG